MRTITGGDGSDQTAAVQAWLLGNNSQLEIAELYQINTPYLLVGGNVFQKPTPFFVTGYGGPLKYNKIFEPDGVTIPTFLPSVISRDQLNFSVGLDDVECKVTWAPKASNLYGIPSGSAQPATSIQQAFVEGKFNNGSVRIWKVYMPTPGDANTFGVMELWMGRIAQVDVSALGIEISCKGFTDLLEDQIPRYIIQPGNRTNQQGMINSVAAFGSQVIGPAVAGEGITIAGSTRTAIRFNGPTMELYAPHSLAGMYVQLDTYLPARIYDNTNDGTHNTIYIQGKFPTAPGTGLNLLVQSSIPADVQTQPDGSQQLPGFPFVPRPEDQV
jgi:hypothetical protein